MRPQPSAHHAKRIPADQRLLEALQFITAAAERLPDTTAACAEFGAARLRLWRGIGPPMLQALGLPPEASDDELQAVARDADLGFRLSSPLCPTPVARALLAEARRLRDRTALAMLGLAADFARVYRGSSHCELLAEGDDALQEALEFILVAIDRFDPARGVRLSTYSAHYARRGVQDARFASSTVLVNQPALTRWGEVEQTEARLRQRLGRQPTHEEVVAEVGSAQIVATARAIARALHSMPPAEGADAVDEGALDPEAALVRVEERERLRAAIDRAAPRGTRRRIVVETLAAGGRVEDACRAIGRRRTTCDSDRRRVREELRGLLREGGDPACEPRLPREPLRPERVVPTTNAPRVQEPAEASTSLSGVMLL